MKKFAEFVKSILTGARDKMCRDCRDIKLVPIFAWEMVKGSICARLINADANREMLEIMPHRFLLDMAVVYYFKVCGMTKDEWLPLENSHADMWWEQDEESLYRTAVENMRREGRVLFKDAAILAGERMPKMKMAFAHLCKCVKMYVLTNQDVSFGAAELLDVETLRNISKELSGDFIVLPSSVHEVFIIQADNESDYLELKSVVCEVNATRVREDERLSDHVYRYDSKSGILKIAA